VIVALDDVMPVAVTAEMLGGVTSGAESCPHAPPDAHDVAPLSAVKSAPTSDPSLAAFLSALEPASE
jgi:hypothetical protein